jgi:ankyrin repeat protein
MDEISEVVAIDFAREVVFDKDEMLVDPLEVLDICSSLVKVTTSSSGNKFENNGTQKCMLAHASVKEFLIANKFDRDRGTLYCLPQDYCHGKLARANIGYILQLPPEIYDANSHFHPDFDPQGVTRKFKLLDRSLDWVSHYELASEPDQDLERSVLKLKDSTEALHYWLYAHWRRGHNRRHRIGHGEDLLSYAMRLRADRLIRCLLNNGLNVNGETDNDGTTYLHLAVQREDPTSTRILLENGANVNAMKRRSEVGVRLYLDTPLHQAARRGNQELVRLLLAYDAKVDIKESCGTPLCAVTRWLTDGAYEMVELLLEHGASVNARGEEESALLLAASKNHEVGPQLVRLLLQHGAVVNDQGAELFHIAVKREPGVALLLMQTLLSLNSETIILTPDLLSSLMQVAVSKVGHLKVVQFLMQRGVDINEQGKGSLLQMALSVHRNYEIVKFLLENGTYTKASLSQQTLLTVLWGEWGVDAWMDSYIDFFPALMNHKVFYDAFTQQEGIYWLLYRICYWKHKSEGLPIIRMILQSAVKLNSTFSLPEISKYHPLFRVIILSNYDELLGLLWAHGATVDAKESSSALSTPVPVGVPPGVGWSSISALQYAVEDRRLDIISFLLDRGFDVESDIQNLSLVELNLFMGDSADIMLKLRDVFKRYGYGVNCVEKARFNPKVRKECLQIYRLE